ncbi:hypothetical protein GCM10010389_42920 [Streptomyces echinoruber]|uniref:Uncharacterized protein n=1 Tax=Streptomyces echinoruber TaxID=68898 RepID=A0A918VIF2_9ACTN|nr:hypothetical protein GCM10010389_42920 [Streptomyces echinoruber]
MRTAARIAGPDIRVRAQHAVRQSATDNRQRTIGNGRRATDDRTTDNRRPGDRTTDNRRPAAGRSGDRRKEGRRVGHLRGGAAVAAGVVCAVPRGTTAGFPWLVREVTRRAH